MHVYIIKIPLIGRISIKRVFSWSQKPSYCNSWPRFSSLFGDVHMFNCTWNWAGLEHLTTSANFWIFQNELINLGDVKKAGVLGAARPDPEWPRSRNSTCYSSNLEIKNDWFYSVLKQRDKVLSLFTYWVLAFFELPIRTTI